MRRAFAALALLALHSAPALAANQSPLPEGVCETTASTGTGTINLAGALVNYRTFASAVTSGNSVKYNIVTGVGASRKTETGEGVFTDATPDTLTRVVSWSSDGVGTALTLSGISNVCVGWNSGWATEGDWGINAQQLAGVTPGAGGLGILDDVDAAAIRTSLGLVIGTNVQAVDTDLTTIAGLTATTDNFMVAASSAWASRTPAQAIVSLCGADPNTDKIAFWDDSAGTCVWLTPPTNFIISGTTATIREAIVVALSDETTNLTTGVGKAEFQMPYAFTLTSVRCTVSTAQTAGTILTFDINDGGTSIMTTTKVTIDNSETSSFTAAAQPVLTDTALANDAVISFDIDVVGTAGARGAKCTLIGNQ